MLSALGGCKLLRELSKLESETENKLAMKELAQRFEVLAHGESDHRQDCWFCGCLQRAEVCGPKTQKLFAFLIFQFPRFEVLRFFRCLKKV